MGITSKDACCTFFLFITGVYSSEERKERPPRLSLDAVSEEGPALTWLAHASLARVAWLAPSLAFFGDASSLRMVRRGHVAAWRVA